MVRALDMRLKGRAGSIRGRYDTIRYVTRCYFNVRSKADVSQLNRTARKQQLKSVKQKKAGNSLGQAVRTHMCLCHQAVKLVPVNGR